jgi:hypothetical protein
MPEGTEAKIKQDLSAEIVQLDESYRQIRSSLSEKEYDAFAVACSIRAFKDSLSRASAYTLTLYKLRGQKVNIPWEQLFTNLITRWLQSMFLNHLNSEKLYRQSFLCQKLN